MSSALVEYDTSRIWDLLNEINQYADWKSKFSSGAPSYCDIIEYLHGIWTYKIPADLWLNLLVQHWSNIYYEHLNYEQLR